MKTKLDFILNGERCQIEVDAARTLLDILRNELQLTGTKEGCGHGECGTCTVIVDGRAVNSCLILAPKVMGCHVTTIEGLEGEGKLHPLQEAFIRNGAMQCGFCTPGMILSAKALLDRTPHPTKDEIREAISGNLCRCTGYVQIVEAISDVVQRRKKGVRDV